MGDLILTNDSTNNPCDRGYQICLSIEEVRWLKQAVLDADDSKALSLSIKKKVLLILNRKDILENKL